MQYLRLIIRLPSIFLWTTAWWLLRLCLWPTALFSDPADRRVRQFIARGWAVGFFPMIGMRLRVRGPKPKHPFFLVCNHLSYIDPWLLNGLIACTFVSRGDVANWPVIGAITRSLHVVFINRRDKRDTARVNQHIDHALKQGDGLVVFAESRISRGLSVEPFKSALIQPAVANQLPIHYATIIYEGLPGAPPASDYVGWWRPEPFLYHLFRLLRHKGFIATVHFGEAPMQGDDRKELARQLHEAVKANYTPMD